MKQIGVVCPKCSTTLELKVPATGIYRVDCAHCKRIFTTKYTEAVVSASVGTETEASTALGPFNPFQYSRQSPLPTHPGLLVQSHVAAPARPPIPRVQQRSGDGLKLAILLSAALLVLVSAGGAYSLWNRNSTIARDAGSSPSTAQVTQELELNLVRTAELLPRLRPTKEELEQLCTSYSIFANWGQGDGIAERLSSGYAIARHMIDDPSTSAAAWRLAKLSNLDRVAYDVQSLPAAETILGPVRELTHATSTSTEVAAVGVLYSRTIQIRSETVAAIGANVPYPFTSSVTGAFADLVVLAELASHRPGGMRLANDIVHGREEIEAFCKEIDDRFRHHVQSGDPTSETARLSTTRPLKQQPDRWLISIEGPFQDPDWLLSEMKNRFAEPQWSLVAGGSLWSGYSQSYTKTTTPVFVDGELVRVKSIEVHRPGVVPRPPARIEVTSASSSAVLKQLGLRVWRVDLAEQKIYAVAD